MSSGRLDGVGRMAADAVVRGDAVGCDQHCAIEYSYKWNGLVRRDRTSIAVAYLARDRRQGGDRARGRSGEQRLCKDIHPSKTHRSR